MSNIVVDKPVATTGVANTLAVAIVGYCIYRGWIPEPLGLVAIGVVVVALTTIAHELVAPWGKVKHIVQDGLHITDADFGRFEAVLEQYGLELIAKVEQPAPAPQPAVAAHAAPDGMSAGAPTPSPAAGSRLTQGDFVPPTEGA